MLTRQIDVFQVQESQQIKDWFEPQPESVQISFLLAVAEVRIETIEIEFRAIRGTHSKSLQKQVLARVSEPLSRFALAVESACDSDVFLGATIFRLAKNGTEKQDQCLRAGGAGRPTWDRSATAQFDFNGVAA